jgi:hypothetical protein
MIQKTVYNSTRRRWFAGQTSRGSLPFCLDAPELPRKVPHWSWDERAASKNAAENKLLRSIGKLLRSKGIDYQW